jgi:nucleotide-binding universal stress UspA family protein
MKTIRKILVPTDFSEGATIAMHEALDLARLMGAEVTLLYVYQLPTYVLPDGSAVIVTATAHAELITSMDRNLREAVEEANVWEVPVASATREGATADQIVAFAREGQFDMVVMGTHGRTGLKHMFLGSVAEKVVRMSTVPVLTIRQPRDGRATASAPVL